MIAALNKCITGCFMQSLKRILIFGAVLLLIIFVKFIPSVFQGFNQRATDLVIVSGSENKDLEPLISDWAKTQGKKIQVV